MRRAKHNLGHHRVTAGDFGKLYPFSCTEILPGDTFRCKSSALVRLQPLMTPLMHHVNISIAHFFVPNRLTWSDFEAFITGRNTTATVPKVPSVTKDDITDYMGVPPHTNADTTNALPVRAYNLIYNEFYRDQDLQPERTTDQQDVANVAWSKDYFTTARQYPQFGDATQAAVIRFDNEIPIAGVGVATNKVPVSRSWNETGGNVRTTGTYQSADSGDANLMLQEDPSKPGFPYVRIAAGTAVGSVDINDWRRAMALQKFLEHRNKFGSRYKDYLAMLGVNSPDSRLDRPEYLGGGRQTIAFSEVLQTVESENVPLGSQGGHGIAAIRTRPWKKMFLEHGYVVSLVSIRPKSMYMTAQDKTWLRTRKDDFWQKEHEILGEQPINNREIFATHNDNEPFGYAPRHDDYRTQRSYVTGPMRTPEHATWHMARDFQNMPGLNDDFLKCDPTKRVFRSANDPQFTMMINNSIAARRLVSKFARN